jgi:hypothetical protein
MSIIEEALRRAQGQSAPGAPQTPASQLPKPAPSPDTRPAHSWQPTPAASPETGLRAAPLNLVALAVLLLTAALVIGGAFWMGRALPRASAARGATAGLAAHTASPAAAKTAAARPPAKRRTGTVSTAIVLSGVVEGVGESYAVINGEIYGVGERIGDATLGQIANGAVTLRHDNGRETVLRVPR